MRPATFFFREKQETHEDSEYVQRCKTVEDSRDATCFSINHVLSHAGITLHMCACGRLVLEPTRL